MPQLSLYLDDATMNKLRHDAAEAGASLSAYTGELIRNANGAAWPAAFLNTYGAISDQTFQAPIELDASLDGPITAL